ncbi:MAG: hypothetical protein IKF82_00220 [Bacilli bacterium]|nr:hypothetical protein [Bacilli bacterium]
MKKIPPAAEDDSGSNQNNNQQQQNQTSTYDVAFNVSDADGSVQGIVITLTNTTDSTKVYTSSSSGTAGGCSISGKVDAGTYIATTSNNTGYEDYTSSNITVDKDMTGSNVISVVLTKTTSP